MLVCLRKPGICVNLKIYHKCQGISTMNLLNTSSEVNSEMLDWTLDKLVTSRHSCFIVDITEVGLQVDRSTEEVRRRKSANANVFMSPRQETRICYGLPR